MFFAYVLESEKDNKFYYGSAEDIYARLDRHNAGKVASTKSRRPFKIIGYIRFATRQEAIKQEMKFKKNKNRQYVLKILQNYGAIV